MRIRSYLFALAVLIAVRPAEAQRPLPTRPHRSDTVITVHEGTSLSGVVSPDGQKAAFIILGEVFLADLASGRATPLFDQLADPNAYDAVAWSPDGKSLLLQSSYHNPNGLFVIDVTSKKRTPITSRSDFVSISWLHTGQILAIAPGGDSLEIREYAAAPNGQVVRIGKAPANASFFSADADGRTIIFASPVSSTWLPLPDTRLRALDVATGKLRDIDAAGDLDDAPVESPDGKLIVFTSEKSGDRELWVANADGTNRRQITHGIDDVQLTPKSWSRDARRVFFSAHGRFYAASLDGTVAEIPFSAPFRVARWSGLRNPVIPEAGTVRSAKGIADPAFSPDGRTIAFAALGDLWTAPTRGGAPTRVTNTPLIDEKLPQFSPDGKTLSFISVAPGSDFALNVMQLSGNAAVKTFRLAPESYAWSPDSKRIAFARFTELGWVDVNSAAVHHVASPRQPISSLAGWSGNDTLVFATSTIVRDSTSDDRAIHTYFSVVARDSARPSKRDIAAPLVVPQSRWTRDWTRVAYARGPRGYWSESTGGSQPITIADPSPREFAWTPDGSSLGYLSLGRLRLLDIASGRARTLEVSPNYTVAESPPPLLIRNARILDGRAHPVTAAKDVLLERGRIARIRPAGTIRVSPAVRVVDAGGRVLMPGLFDLHTHMGDEPAFPEYLWYGVTSIRDVGTRGEWVRGQRERAESGEISPRIFYSGGQITSLYGLGDRGNVARLEAESDPRSVSDQVSSVGANGADVVKVYFRNNAFDALAADAAHANGLRITGHFLSPGMVARGQDGKEHSHTYYGVDGWTSPWREDMIALAKASHMCVTPTLVVYAFWQTRGRSKAFPLDSSVLDEPATAKFLPPFRRTILRDLMRNKLPDRAQALWERRFTDDIASVGRLSRAGVRIGAGTDTGPEGRSLQIELELLVKAGLTPLEAIRAATYDAAGCVGVEKSLGSVEEGKLADLVLVDGDPSTRIQDAAKVSTIFLGGRLLTRADLEKAVPQLQ